MNKFPFTAAVYSNHYPHIILIFFVCLMNRAVIASNSNESRRTEIEFGYDDDGSVNFNHGKVKGERERK